VNRSATGVCGINAGAQTGRRRIHLDGNRALSAAARLVAKHVTEPTPLLVSEMSAKTNGTLSERLAKGKALRQRAPRSAHAHWEPGPDRPDPVALLESSSQGRVPELIPIRYGRMLPSPFMFFRGSAAAMAFDLAATPPPAAHGPSAGQRCTCFPRSEL
jgi:hypothetical protein